jgi:hypothetical protein
VPVWRLQLDGYTPQASENIGFYLVLPDSDDAPTRASEAAEISLVAPAVSLNLVFPKLRDLVLPTRVAKTVPEIAVDEHSQFVLGEDQVWTSCKRPDVPAESIASQAQLTGNQQFDVGPFMANTGHEATAPFWREEIQCVSTPTHSLDGA